tara:strand:+ start:4825 stop:5700 length:876 start_codon:yes stop_codon:yes gene_type:complete
VGKTVSIKSSWAAVRDHTRHFSDFTFVYPVISRRSGGLSIGVNVNPDKVCNFDCVYCEVDRREPGAVSRVDLNQLRDELAAMIGFAQDGGLAKEPRFDEVPWLTREVRDIAFSGDGEPTMIRNFDKVVEVVAEVKAEAGLKDTKIVLITDAAGLDKVSVRRGLELMDAHNGEVWGKLDAGTEEYFKAVNRTTVKFQRVLDNLCAVSQDRKILIQSLFLKMHGERMSAEELWRYCSRLNDITDAGGEIREVQAYTVARPTPEKFATKLTREELEAIAGEIHARTALPVSTYD